MSRRLPPATQAGGAQSGPNSEALQFAPESVYSAVPGFYGSLTPAQTRVLAELKTHVQERNLDIRAAKHPREHVDTFLLRFLRARKFNLKKAFQMLKDDVEWREEWRVSELRRQTPEQILGCARHLVDRHLPIWQRGFDREGRPVFYQHAMRFYVDRMLDHTTLDAALRYHVWKAEKASDLCVLQSERSGCQIETTCVLIDVRGMQMSQITRAFYSYMKAMSAIDQDHYPERMGTVFIVNIPWAFSIVWGVIKPWLDARTKQKIRIYRDGYTNELLQLIDPEDLPAAYGGSGDDLVVKQHAHGAGAAAGAREGASASDSCTSGEGTSDSRASSIISGDDEDFFDAVVGDHADDAGDLSDNDGAHAGGSRSGELWPRSSPPAGSDSERGRIASAQGSGGEAAAGEETPTPVARDNSGNGSNRGIGQAYWVINGCWQKTRHWNVQACEKALHRMNAFFLLIGVLLISMGGYVQAGGWWRGSIVDWTFWSTAGMISLGCCVAALATLGFLGTRRRSETMLSVYIGCLGLLAVLLLLLSIMVFAMMRKAEAVLSTTWDTLQAQELIKDSAADPNVPDKEGVARALRDHQVLLGTCSLIAAMLTSAPCFFAVRLRQAIRIELPASGSLFSQREKQLRALLRFVTLLNALFGLVCVGYGGHVFGQQKHWTVIFTPFMLLALGFSLIGTSALGQCASRSSGTSLLLVHTIVVGVNCLVWFIAGAVALSLVPHTEEALQKKNSDVSPDAVSATKKSLVAIGVLELFIGITQVLSCACTVWLRRIVAATISSLAIGRGSISNDSNGQDQDLRRRPLSSVQRWLVFWALCSGLISIFWQGEYAVFNQMLDDKGDSSQPWFLRGWDIYARADRRYYLSDDFIVSMEGFSALVAGPLLLIYAWSVFQHTAFRDACGLFVATMQVVMYALYFTTAFYSGLRHCAPTTDVLYFWFLFVFVNVLRFAMAVFVLAYSLRNIVGSARMVKLLELDDERAAAFRARRRRQRSKQRKEHKRRPRMSLTLPFRRSRPGHRGEPKATDTAAAQSPQRATLPKQRGRKPPRRRAAHELDPVPSVEVASVLSELDSALGERSRSRSSRHNGDHSRQSTATATATATASVTPDTFV